MYYFIANINIFLRSDFIGQKLQWELESPILLVLLWRRTMFLLSPVVFQRFLAIKPIFPFSFFYPFSVFSKPWPFCDIPLSSALTKCCCLSLCYVWKWIKWRWGEMGHCVASAFGTHCVQSSQLPWSPLEAYRGAIQHCFFLGGGRVGAYQPETFSDICNCFGTLTVWKTEILPSVNFLFRKACVFHLSLPWFFTL